MILKKDFLSRKLVFSNFHFKLIENPPQLSSLIDNCNICLSSWWTMTHFPISVGNTCVENRQQIHDYYAWKLSTRESFCIVILCVCQSTNHWISNRKNKSKGTTNKNSKTEGWSFFKGNSRKRPTTEIYLKFHFQIHSHITCHDRCVISQWYNSFQRLVWC